MSKLLGEKYYLCVDRIHSVNSYHALNLTSYILLLYVGIPIAARTNSSVLLKSSLSCLLLG